MPVKMLMTTMMIMVMPEGLATTRTRVETHGSLYTSMTWLQRGKYITMKKRSALEPYEDVEASW